MITITPSAALTLTPVEIAGPIAWNAHNPAAPKAQASMTITVASFIPQCAFCNEKNRSVEASVNNAKHFSTAKLATKFDAIFAKERNDLEIHAANTVCLY